MSNNIEDIKILEKYINFNEICGTRNFKQAIEEAKSILSLFSSDEENRVYQADITYAIENILQYIDQLENKVKELEATKDKYLQKLVYALTPTTHELSTNNNNAFKQIVTDNIDLETCKIKRKLKEFWGIDKY